MLSTNVAEADANHAATLLGAARELLQVLPQARAEGLRVSPVSLLVRSRPAALQQHQLAAAGNMLGIEPLLEPLRVAPVETAGNP